MSARTSCKVRQVSAGLLLLDRLSIGRVEHKALCIAFVPKRNMDDVIGRRVTVCNCGELIDTFFTDVEGVD
jgi:hypothetical protein